MGLEERIVALEKEIIILKGLASTHAEQHRVGGFDEIGPVRKLWTGLEADKPTVAEKGTAYWAYDTQVLYII